MTILERTVLTSRRILGHVARVIGAIAFAVVCLAPADALAVPHSTCNTDADCVSDGRFCNGVEHCGSKQGRRFCVSGPSPCDRFQECDEDADKCIAPPFQCSRDADCSDNVVCNGAERCTPGVPGADSRGCSPANEPACPAGQTCVESTGRCTACPTAEDADGDGAISIQCGGSDCNDADAATFPGNREICDGTNHDEDCDPLTFGNTDEDGDRWVLNSCCNVKPGGELACGTDCNDADPSIHPTNPEVCDQIDNDCDGSVDEEVRPNVPLLRRLYADDDSDGFGNPSLPIDACSTEPGIVANNFDCDDTNQAIVPSAMICFGPSAVKVCFDGELSDPEPCPPELVCVVQPNGTGVCQ